MRFRPFLPVVAAVLLMLVAGATPASAARKPPPPPRDTTPPTAPSNLQAPQVGQTSVTLTWGPSTDNVGIVEYAAWAPGLPIMRTPPSQTTVTFTGLHPNSTYEFRVQAWDGWNWSWPSNLLPVTTQRELVPPSAPSGLQVSNTLWGQPVDGVTASAVLVTWTSSTDNFGPIRYEVLVDGAVTPNADDIVPAGIASGPTGGAWIRQLDPG
ncbi:MAG: fibronectin type III domain-containing protein, partial [Pseudonocardiaceae bacterium]